MQFFYNRSIRVVILTGEGPVFSWGGNVKDMQRYSAGDLSTEVIREKYRNGIQRLARALFNLDAPGITSIHGRACRGLKWPLRGRCCRRSGTGLQAGVARGAAESAVERGPQACRQNRRQPPAPFLT